MTREEAQEALNSALSVQSAAKVRLALAVAAVTAEKANVMDADADVMKARAALQRLGGPVVAAGAPKTGQSDLCAAVTKVLQASATPLTVDQILAAVQADGVDTSKVNFRDNLGAYISRWSKVPGATIASGGRGLWKAAGAPEVPAFLAPPTREPAEGEMVDEGTTNTELNAPVPAFLAAPEADPAPVQESTEEPKTEQTGDLPFEFPGREALVEAGYTYREQLAGKTHDQLRRIKGVGAETARQILAALEA